MRHHRRTSEWAEKLIELAERYELVRTGNVSDTVLGLVFPDIELARRFSYALSDRPLLDARVEKFVVGPPARVTVRRNSPRPKGRGLSRWASAGSYGGWPGRSGWSEDWGGPSSIAARHRLRRRNPRRYARRNPENRWDSFSSREKYLMIRSLRLMRGKIGWALLGPLSGPKERNRKTQEINELGQLIVELDNKGVKCTCSYCRGIHP